jgi:hypothetical protein
MKKIFSVIALILAFISTANSDIGQEPDKIILSNRFVEIEWVRDQLFALSEMSLLLFKWNIEKHKFEEVDQVILPLPAKSMKITPIGIVIRHGNDDISIVEINYFNKMTLLGTLAPPVEYSDFEIAEGNLYLSRWFDGIDEYSIENFKSLTFIRNEKSGVVVTNLEAAIFFLYGLDLYNGIIRYDLRNGFGSNISRWNLTERAFSIELNLFNLFISGNDSSVLAGEFVNDSARVFGEFQSVQGVQRARSSAWDIAFMSERKVSIADLRTLSVTKTVVLDSLWWKGAVGIIVGMGKLLALPNLNGGISLTLMSDLSEYQQALERPGPINAILLHDNFLFTGGGQNPLEVYEIAGDSVLDPISLGGRLYGLKDLAISGNHLYALFDSQKKVVVFDVTEPAHPQLTGELDLSIDDSRKLLVNDSLILAIGKRQIEWHHNSIGGGNWYFDNPIVDVETIQNTLYVTDVLGKINAYSINADLSLNECAERNLTGTGWSMDTYQNSLFVFAGRVLTVFNQCLELDTIVHLSEFVLDAQIKDDTLLTVGPDGIAKYRLSSGLPELVDRGGFKGNQFSADKGVIATTDGSSINLYIDYTSESAIDSTEFIPISTTLLDNYPNPFNAITNISFELAIDTWVEVEIINLLGQRVKRIAEGTYSPGRHSVVWDGTDERGKEVTTGVYFYRMKSDVGIVSKKMLLLK